MPALGRGAGARPRTIQASPANVFVEPVVSRTLWFGTLDPALPGNPPADMDAMAKLYAGLVKEVYDDRTGHVAIVPDLAGDLPAVSRNGRIYTFTLRPNARFSDGSPVTAQDAIYSLNRALLPAEKSPAAGFYLGDILGAPEVVAGKATMCRGLKAIGTRVVQITLARSISYFLFELAQPLGVILKHTVPAQAPLTTDPRLVVGAGPFMLKDGTWQYRRQVTLVPNPYYYNARNIKLKEIDLVFTGSEESAFLAYQAGQFPMAQLPAAEVARYRNTPEFHETASLWDAFLVMNLRVKPFSNRHFRRAVAFAINRDAIANGVFHGAAKPLYSWYPRGILGYDPRLQSQVPHYDPAIARKELALARKELGRIPSPIPLVVLAVSGDWLRMDEEVQSNLRAIGITVSLHPADTLAFESEVLQGKTPIYSGGWIADYPDPQDYSEGLLGTGGAANWGHYSNRTVDALFARAAVERNPTIRAQLYQQAQTIILNDAPVAMLTQFAAQAVISTRYHGLELNPLWATIPQPVQGDWAQVTVSP